MMRLRVDDIKENGLLLEFSEPPEDFPALAELTAEEEGIAFLAPLQIRLRAIRVQELVEVEGSLDTRLRYPCSRCLQAFEAPLAVSFDLTYARDIPEAIDSEDEEGIELTPEDLGLIPFQGEEIDLREGLQEQVVMALPLQPLCNVSCRGLCPHCGADLNRKPCGCTPPVFGNKFAALKDLKVETKKES